MALLRLLPASLAACALALPLAPSAAGQGATAGGQAGKQAPAPVPRGQPGTYGGPGDTVPPPAPGGTGGIGGPATPAPPGGSADLPPTGTPPPPGGGLTPFEPPFGPGGPTGPGAVALLPGTGDGAFLEAFPWWLWWELSRERWLAVREHLYVRDPATGADALLGSAALDVRPSAADVRGRIVPALLRVLAREGQPDLLRAALVALGRVADDHDPATRTEAARAVRPLVASGSREVADAAVAALGILGDEASLPLLADLLRDAPAGRAAAGGGAVPERTRALAAYALGLAAGPSERVDVRRYAVHHLAAVLEREARGRELPAACAIALGLVAAGPAEVPPDPPTPGARAREAPPASASLADEVRFLARVLDDDDRDALVRAQVPLALGRLLASAGGPGREALRAEVATRLLDALARSREDAAVVRGAIVALGLLGDGDGDLLDQRIRRALRDVERVTADRSARNLALLALGRASGRAGGGPPDALREERRALARELARGTSEARPWAALGLALLERGIQEAGGTTSPAATAGLRVALADARSHDDVASIATALGLVRDPRADEPLLERLEESAADEVRGPLAVALGMIRAERARAPLRALLADSTQRPWLLRELATALVLLHDDLAATTLATELARGRGTAVQTSVARALGRCGDQRAVDPLLALLEHGPSGRARAAAAAALGEVADRDPLPWWTPLGADLDVLAAPEALWDRFETGLLALR